MTTPSPAPPAEPCPHIGLREWMARVGSDSSSVNPCPWCEVSRLRKLLRGRACHYRWGSLTSCPTWALCYGTVDGSHSCVHDGWKAGWPGYETISDATHTGPHRCECGAESTGGGNGGDAPRTSDVSDAVDRGVVAHPPASSVDSTAPTSNDGAPTHGGETQAPRESRVSDPRPAPPRKTLSSKSESAAKEAVARELLPPEMRAEVERLVSADRASYDSVTEFVRSALRREVGVARAALQSAVKEAKP